MPEFLYYMRRPVVDLMFGVSRSYSWWEEHPAQKRIFKKIKTSIKRQGIRNPLTVNQTNKGYIVEVGNQRLQALKELKEESAPCVVYTNKENKSLSIINSKKELKSYFKDGINKFISFNQISPADVDLWAVDK